MQLVAPKEESFEGSFTHRNIKKKCLFMFNSLFGLVLMFKEKGMFLREIVLLSLPFFMVLFWIIS